MAKHIKYEPIIIISNTLIRIFGNIIKILSFPFHALFPKTRFTIPEFSSAKFTSNKTGLINKTIWQTNYSNKVTLPIYCNYLVNRLFSLNYNYHYVSTEAREEYIKDNAEPHIFAAYKKLTDGASQADFWRLFVLYQEGGIYIDIDGHLVWPLSSIITENDHEVLITRRNKYTNFFIASEKGSTFLKDTLDIIIDNIKQRRVDGGVFSLTGPDTLNTALKDKVINTRRDKLTCIQGTFSNEYFQYMDKKHSKWNHKRNDELLK